MAKLSRLKDDYHGTRMWLVGPECAGMLMAESAKLAGQVEADMARDTGRLAASTNVEYGVYIGEEAAWTGYVQTSALRDGRSYAAPHEFGWTDKSGEYHPGAHEMRNVLRRNQI